MIVFNEIPSGIRTPFSFIEFDASRATSGLPQFPSRLLVIGQRLSTGTAPALTPVLVTNLDQAIAAFGRGSQLHHMIERVRENNTSTETYAIGVNDLPAGTAAAWTLDFTGTVVTETGLLSIYVGGRRTRVRVTAGNNDATVAGAVQAALAADPNLPVTATLSSATVVLTAKHAGEAGNDIDTRFTYYAGERRPQGIKVVVSQTVNGSGNPDIAPVLAAVGGEHFEYIISPWTDAANMGALEGWLVSEAGPTVMRESIAFAARQGTVGQLTTWGDGRNNQFVSCMGYKGSPSPAYEWAAAYGAVGAFQLQIDPARPLQTLTLAGLLAPEAKDRFARDEQDILLHHGVATHMVATDGGVQIQREVTTWQENAFGQPDAAWLDVQTPATLAFLRKDIRFLIETKFPRHKLADDGTRILAGQPIVTPKVIKDEIIARAVVWEANGLVENIDRFKRELVVERNDSDRNRVDAVIPTDLINQFRVFAGQLQFII